ncbi:hypothetical protein JXA88_09295 [Candidatus Fermentibacteria bacterium]|nr:hypothetical protein [Candidatus Fermentibacteria bacterium]
MHREAHRYLSSEEQRQLAARVQGGDDSAFGTLYEHFFEALRGYVAGRVHSADAADIVSETFAAALPFLRDGRYDPQFSVYTLLRVMADSQIDHHLRRTHVAAASTPDQPTPQYQRRLRPLAEIPEIAAQPSQEIEAATQELLLLVLACGAKPHQALAFCLIGFLEWRPREVAEQLGSRSLFTLTRRVYDDMSRHAFTDAGRRPLCRDHCPWFWQRLVAPVRDVYPEQEYDRARALTGPVGDLHLSTFFGPKPSASLSDWCHKVRRRARNALETGMLLMEERHTARS